MDGSEVHVFWEGNFISSVRRLFRACRFGLDNEASSDWNAVLYRAFAVSQVTSVIIHKKKSHERDRAVTERPVSAAESCYSGTEGTGYVGHLDGQLSAFHSGQELIMPSASFVEICLFVL